MSKIEWTDQTWNPVVGCTNISAGCDNCYAEIMANRFNHAHYAGVVSMGKWTGLINKAPDHILGKPLKIAKPTVFFVNSMSDMFHDGVQDEWLIEIFETMNRAPHHTFQVLTKRPSRAVRKTRELGLRWTDNIWAGTSIEDDRYSLPRSRELLKIDAAIRFISAEPLLGALPSLPIADLDWIIASGESGRTKAIRPADPVWFRDLRDRCRAARTPFFFKQWGAYGEDGVRRSKDQNGHMLDGEEIFEMPAAAYDRMPSPDPRWTRVSRETRELAQAGLAATKPSQRLMASPGKYVIDFNPQDDDEEIVFQIMLGKNPTIANPNKPTKLTAETEASYVDFYK